MLKRQEDFQDTCSIVVVADYRFFRFLRSSESNVIDTIVSLYIITQRHKLVNCFNNKVSRIDAADRLSFRPAEWIINANGDTMTGLGLQIGAVRVSIVICCFIYCFMCIFLFRSLSTLKHQLMHLIIIAIAMNPVSKSCLGYMKLKI